MSIIRNGLLSADLDVPVVLPTLNLDFANSQSLDKRITFSRGSIGTRVNKNGLIETIAANQPRFDYDPVTGECKGLLIEESRTNLFTYSEDYTTWNKQNSSISSNITTAPNGNNTATKLIENTTNTIHYVYKGRTGSNETVTWSVFCKAAERNRVLLQLSNFSTSATDAYFSLIGSGSVLSLSANNADYTNSSASIISYPNGWYRCILTTTKGSVNTTNNPVIASAISGSAIYQGDGTSGIYIWGAQLEVGAFPTSYIPTTTSAVTRSVDNVEMTGTNFSSWYNQTEGTFFYNGTLPFISNDTIGRVPYGVSNGFSFANSMYVSKISTSLGLSFYAINNNLNVSPFTSLPNMTSSKIKIASSVAPNNIYSCGYGGVVNKHSKSSAAIPTVTRLTLGKEPWNTSALNPIIGCINKFAYYPRALSPAQLQTLTS